MILRVLLIEDDPLQAEWFAEQIIWIKFPEAEIKYYDSEYSFLSDEETIKGWKPTHALLDRLVRYYSINDMGSENFQSKEPPPFPERAGLRCLEKLKEICPSCKSVLITVNDVNNEENRLQKGSPTFSSSVVDFLRRK